jgi:hypothetical protein
VPRPDKPRPHRPAPLPALLPWPLLPDPAAATARDQPLMAAFDAMALLAAALLLLRALAPETAPGVASAVALHGGTVAHHLCLVLVPLSFVAPMVLMVAPGRPAPPAPLLLIYDQLLHLALVLAAVAALAALVLRGTPDLPFQWFMAETAMLWLCHRARLALVPAEEPGR